jgi:hypothetical protein
MSYLRRNFATCKKTTIVTPSYECLHCEKGKQPFFPYINEYYI